MSDWIRWSHTRLLTTLAIGVLIFMEPVSWMMAPLPLCLVPVENYGGECPTFHVFLYKNLAIVLGDHDWITAIATAFIAAFTVVSAVALKGQLRLTRALEAPIPVVVGTKLVQYVNANGPPIPPDPVPAGPIPNFCRALVAVENKGRTPFRIVRYCVEWQVLNALPAQPVYRNFEAWNSLIGPNQILWLMAGNLADIQLTAQQHASVQAQQAYLWVFGYFWYRDFTNETYSVGFLSRWDLNNAFVREPNQNYEYQRKTN